MIRHKLCHPMQDVIANECSSSLTVKERLARLSMGAAALRLPLMSHKEKGQALYCH